MNISATILCETMEQEEKIASQLKALPGVTVRESTLAIAVDFAPTDTMSISEENRSVARLIDIVESVTVHGIVVVP